jgi:gliding motility-associated-like protein
MKQKALFFIISMFLLATNGFGQAVNPLAYYNDRDGNALEGTSIDDGEAPLNVRFRPNPSNMGEWIPSYEWHFIQTKSAESQTPKKLFVRYDEEVEYTFNESGTYNVYLKTFLKKTDSTTGTEDTAELDSVTLTITIAESKLEFPNAFSPNDDGINDVYGAKKDYKSIVSFRAIILNRWGQKLYEWNDPAGGWDGTYNGNDVKQGVYYVFVQAKGADGKDYKIRKDVNLLRGYTENKNTGDE